MKENDFKTLIRILSILKPFTKEFLLIGILICLSTLISFAQPLAIQSITDDGMVQKDMSVITVATAALAALVIVGQIISIAQARIFVNIHNASYYTLFHRAFIKLMRMEKSYFEDRNNAEILESVQVDVENVSSVTDRYISNSITYVFKIISGIIGLLVLSWQLTLMVIIVVPIKILVVKSLSKRQESTMSEYIEHNRDFSQWFGDNVNGIEEIKLWGLIQTKEITFRQKMQLVLNIDKSNAMINNWNLFWETLIEWSVTILLYLLGGFLVCVGKLSIGSVFAFASYSWYVTGPISALINLKMYFARIFPSARRLFKFLDAETEPNTGDRKAFNTPPKIELVDVKFQYEATRPILRGINFSVEPGEKIAIIGQNGSGKSTIINLLLRLYPLQEGQILVNGIAANEFSLDEFRSMFSVVSQEPYLFFDDIMHNVDLTGSAEIDKINEALQSSGVFEYLPRMPKGGKTTIGQNGAKLSGGEKQKLAVARALLKDAPVIILDEPTAGFDMESDRYLHEIIVNEMQNKSVILITHHHDDLKGMDRVYQLDNGILTLYSKE